MINLNTFKVVRKGQGRFFWRGFDEFLLITEGGLQLFNLGESEAKLSYESEVEWQDIQFNATGTLFAAISYSSHSMNVSMPAT